MGGGNVRGGDVRGGDVDVIRGGWEEHVWVGGVEWVVMWWKCLCDMPPLSRWCDVLVGGVWWYMLIVVSLSILVWYKAATSLNSQPQLPHPNSTSTN